MRVDSCTAWIFLKRARALSLSPSLSLSNMVMETKSQMKRLIPAVYEKSLHQHSRNFAYMQLYLKNGYPRGSTKYVWFFFFFHLGSTRFSPFVLPLTCTIREAHFFYNLLILFYLLCLRCYTFTSKAEISTAYCDITYGIYRTCFLRVFRTA